MSRPVAIGYLRRDISGSSQAWDETQMRSLAKRFGYDLAKIVVFGAEAADPETELSAVVRRVGAEAVFVPDSGHFGGFIPDVLVQVSDVITVKSETTYARRLLPIRFEDGG